ncbi:MULTISPECIES: DUF4440 domain-containing protein [unclassified Amycolatopsis]|uniref:DUF4440 domain-containing protein n=1 Tax=unclassified Amycolatopsis TaxID=2618356 RepID=UPI00287485F4|nr:MULTISPECIES: DUF4440 domain-containing protein [unclassified Amycolatopsis]MDS0135571.1 DUF4440 domain-containing protein [Amycolatopsis sp. 505]MDS0148413.1 DUF4440 domain-containing protein [Amycolatopsis sp. CM201R]
MTGRANRGRTGTLTGWTNKARSRKLSLPSGNPSGPAAVPTRPGSRLLAPDFHEFGKSGGEFGHEEALRLVANSTDAPITVENLRGSLVADGVVLVKYTSEHAGRRANRTSLWRRVADGHWQIFHHQGTPAAG